MMPTANAENRRTGRRSVVHKDSVQEAAQQLFNIMRLNGWGGELSAILPGERIEHGAFSYWVDSEEGEA